MFDAFAPLSALRPAPGYPAVPADAAPPKHERDNISKASSCCGIRLVDVSKLTGFLEHTACRKCAGGVFLQLLGAFAAYADANADPDKAVTEQLQSSKLSWNGSGRSVLFELPGCKVLAEKQIGAASIFTFECTRLSLHPGGCTTDPLSGHSHHARLWTSKRTAVRKAPEPADFAVNQRLAFAFMGTGRDGGTCSTSLPTWTSPSHSSEPSAPRATAASGA